MARTGSASRSPFNPMPPPSTTSDTSTTDVILAACSAIRAASHAMRCSARSSCCRAAATTSSVVTKSECCQTCARNASAAGLSERNRCPSGTWSISPAAPLTPRCSSPPSTSPAPTPLPIERNAKFRTPAPAPRQPSPTAARLTSFSAITGRSSAAASSALAANPSSACWLAAWTIPVCGSTTPPMPIVATSGAAPVTATSSSRTAAAISSTCAGSLLLTGWSSRASTVPSRSATHARRNRLPRSSASTVAASARGPKYTASYPAAFSGLGTSSTSPAPSNASIARFAVGLDMPRYRASCARVTGCDCRIAR